MAYLKGRNVRIELAATYATAKSITAISNASPGVATSAAHALADGTVGYLTGLATMPQLEGQAARVNAPAASTFELEEIDTTSMGTFSGTASFVPVATWLTLAAATSYAVSGGESERLDSTVLLDTKKQEENGLLGAESVSIDMRSETALSAATKELRKQALAQGFCLLRITLPDGAQRIFRGEPGLPGESVQSGQLGTSSVTLTVKGQFCFLPA